MRQIIAAEMTDHMRFGRKHDKAEAAVRHMGSNAVPCLVRMLQQRDSALKTRALQYGWVQRLARKPLFGDFLEPASNKNRTAAQALGLLGPTAKDAVPALIAALETNPDGQTRCRAAESLGAIGPDAAAAVPALTRVSIVGPERFAAREALWGMGMARTNGLVIALQYEHSPDLAVQTAASVTLEVVKSCFVYGRSRSPEP
jgi:HEAT repeat protein